MKYYCFHIIFFFLYVFTLSCDDGQTTVLTREERSIVDSLYSRELKDLRLITDSICDHINSVEYERAKDSIQEVYIREIQEILEGGNED